MVADLMFDPPSLTPSLSSAFPHLPPGHECGVSCHHGSHPDLTRLRLCPSLSTLCGVPCHGLHDCTLLSSYKDSYSNDGEDGVGGIRKEEGGRDQEGERDARREGGREGGRGEGGREGGRDQEGEREGRWEGKGEA